MNEKQAATLAQLICANNEEFNLIATWMPLYDTGDYVVLCQDVNDQEVVAILPSPAAWETFKGDMEDWR
jgi:hypothetical protein